MKNTRIAVLSAAAACLLPFATPAIAELGHPSGCASCEPVEVTAPTGGYYQEGAPLIAPLLGNPLRKLIISCRTSRMRF